MTVTDFGNFYGTTYMGGANGKGAIFRISPAGVETVLWSFGGSGDGANPTGSLTLGRDGNFYGMTGFGGMNDGGTIFKISPGGAEMVLHSFGSAGDGFDPQGSLLLGPDGGLWGIARGGGANGFGAIFTYR